MGGRALHPQADVFILALISYFEKERDNGGPLIPLSAVHERCANALNISLRTVYNAKRRGGKRLRKGELSELDEATKLEIKKTIVSLKIQDINMNLKLIHETLKAKNVADISITSLKHLLPDIGVTWDRNHRRYQIANASEILPLEVKLEEDSDADMDFYDS